MNLGAYSSHGVDTVKKAWSLAAVAVLAGMVLYAVPRLPEIHFTGWEGLFSIAWLGLAGCVAAGHIRQLRLPGKKYATIKMRKPKRVMERERVRGQG
jgi:hypothetical protein